MKRLIYAALLFLSYCLSTKGQDVCKEYLTLTGIWDMASISLVEVITISNPPKMVTFYYKDQGPCDIYGQRSWNTGYEKISDQGFLEDNGTCSSQYNLSITSDILQPTRDVVFNQVNHNYSTVRPICAENKTALYIKVQAEIAPFHCVSSATFSHPIVGPSNTFSSSRPCFSSLSESPAPTMSCTITTIVPTQICSTSASASKTTAGPELSPVTSHICMKYLVPSLSILVGALIAVILVFVIIAVAIHIKSVKTKANNPVMTSYVQSHNGVYGLEDSDQG